MYPAHVGLVDMIPKGSDLTLSKLAKQAMIMTVTCATAWKFRRLLITEITALTEKEGWSPDEINFLKEITGNIYEIFDLVQSSNNLAKCWEICWRMIWTSYLQSFACPLKLMTYYIAWRRNLGSQQTMQRDMGPFLRIGCKHIIQQHIYFQSFEHVVVRDKTLE